MRDTTTITIIIKFLVTNKLEYDRHGTQSESQRGERDWDKKLGPSPVLFFQKVTLSCENWE